MVVKSKEYFEKTRQVKNNDKSKKFVLRGSLKFCSLYMFKICRHFRFLSIFSKTIRDTKLKFSA